MAFRGSPVAGGRAGQGQGQGPFQEKGFSMEGLTSHRRRDIIARAPRSLVVLLFRWRGDCCEACLAPAVASAGGSDGDAVDVFERVARGAGRRSDPACRGSYGTFAGRVEVLDGDDHAAGGGVGVDGAELQRRQQHPRRRVDDRRDDVPGTTKNITVANSTFTGMAVVRADQMNNANIVFDHNIAREHSTCAAVAMRGGWRSSGGSKPTGVTIKNSTFGPGGDADGIQIGAPGVQVLNNEFTGIKQISAVHTDSLQLYGSSETVIKGNYFHDFDDRDHGARRRAERADHRQRVHQRRQLPAGDPARRTQRHAVRPQRDQEHRRLHRRQDRQPARNQQRRA